MSEPSPQERPPSESAASWDHSTHQEFYDYYAQESASPATLARFKQQRDAILGIPQLSSQVNGLDVADIGSGAGTLAMTWAELGHRVVGLDVNQPLIELARSRARERDLDIRFEVGSATAMPFETGSFDLCFAPELLEHVAAWEACLDEFGRILRPGGVLFLSTTNSLCPLQQEFNLPCYSWYPAKLKRRYEELARTTRPEIANYATYPAVNWFTFYGLRRSLRQRGFGTVMDRFDLAATKPQAGAKKAALTVIRSLAPVRWLSHVASQGSVVVAVKAA